MKRVRIGNDINISLRVLTAGEARPLEGRNLRLVLRDPKGGETEVDFSVVGNTLGFVFFGREQKHIGRYGVELWENEGRALQAVTDVSEAFVLVQRSDEQGGNDTADLRTETIELLLELDDAQACLAALFASGKVDDSLDDDKLVIQRGNTVYTTTVAALQGMLKERINDVEQGLTNTQGTIASAIKSSKSYTDIKVSQAVGETKEYTDELVTQAAGGTKEYAEELVSQAVGETKEYTDEKVSDVASWQLKLSVKDNGNIVLSNANGESKEFMPATPSGDPMHYAYVNAGAEYNATGADIVKNAPWADLADADEDKVVVHKAGYWYLNGLGDLTNTDMSNIYRRGHVSLETDYLAYTITANNIKTNLDCIYKVSYSLLAANFMSYNNEIIVLNTNRNNFSTVQVQWNNNNSFSAAAAQPLKLSHILGLITKTPQNAMIQRAPSLKTIKIKDLMQNISFPDSSMLTTASVLYMISNNTATSAITITLHADAYARAMADARIVEALAAHTNVTLASA